MRAAGMRCAAILGAAFALTGCSRATDTGVHALPSRPATALGATPSTPIPALPPPAAGVPRPSVAERMLATVPTRRIGGLDCVRLSDVAARLGLRYRPHDSARAASLYAPGVRADIDADTRDIIVNGLRVFLGSPVVKIGDDLYVSRIDFERCLTPMLRPGFGVVPLPPPRVIVIDPGHGGSDPGGVNPKLRLMEKTFTLDVALRLRALLVQAGYRVVLTRSEDRLPAPKANDQDLKMRSIIANRERADLFVSIHFNVVEHEPERTRGVEVFTFPPANQHATEWWSQVRKADPDFVTTMEPANQFDHWNVVLADELHRAMLRDLRTDDRGKKLAHFGVLRSLNCPGVLVEPGYITNDAEARKLATPEYRQRIAESLYRGIQDYSGLLERLRPSASPASATTQRRRASRSS